MSYFAEVDGTGIVQRVVVAASAQWCADNLGGTWEETNDPYNPHDQTVVDYIDTGETDPESGEPIMAPVFGDHPLKGVTYCGPGFGHDDTFPEKFAPQWTAWDGTFDDNGNTPYQEGTRVFHNGRIWRSGVANNVWEPGVSAWFDDPLEGDAMWIQPTGAQDAYPLGAIVTHNGSTWESTVDANVWEPGVFGWVDATPAP